MVVQLETSQQLPAVPALFSPTQHVLFSLQVLKASAGEVQLSAYVKQTSWLLGFLNFKEIDTDYFGVYRKWIYFNVCTVNF